MFGNHRDRDYRRRFLSPGHPLMGNAGIKMDGITRLDHVRLSAELDLDAAFFDQNHQLTLEMPRIGPRHTGAPARSQMNSPDVDPVARNHPDQMFEFAASSGYLETLAIFRAKNRDLIPDLDVFEQFARPAIQSVCHFEEDRNRRDRLQVLDLVNRTCRYAGSISELLKCETSLISPTAKSGGNSLQIIIQCLIPGSATQQNRERSQYLPPVRAQEIVWRS